METLTQIAWGLGTFTVAVIIGLVQFLGGRQNKRDQHEKTIAIESLERKYNELIAKSDQQDKTITYLQENLESKAKQIGDLTERLEKSDEHSRLQAGRIIELEGRLDLLQKENEKLVQELTVTRKEVQERDRQLELAQVENRALNRVIAALDTIKGLAATKTVPEGGEKQADHAAEAANIVSITPPPEPTPAA